MRYSFVISGVVLSFVLLCASALPASAASKKELEAKIIQLEQRLSTLENRMLTGDPAAERLMQRMDALETSQRSMTGEVERLQFENGNLQEEVRSLAGQITTLQSVAEDMRRHLKAVELVAQERAQRQAQRSAPITYGSGSGASGVYAGGSSLPPPPTIIQTGPDGTVTNDISQLAELGQSRLNEGDFSGAQSAFKQYLELNPDAADRGDVFFWLGETYYAKAGYSDAADAYIASMRAAPKGDYAPEAMVKLAATARALGKKTMACQTLASFPAQYPKAVPAVREKARIEKIRSGCR